jgi:hypothetical protein
MSAPVRPLAPLAPALFVAVALLAGVGGCDPGFPTTEGSAGISEEDFVEAVVELRRASLLAPSGILPITERDQRLAARGLTAEALRQFVEVHGVDVPYMGQVWSQVERRLNEQVQGGVPSPALQPPATEAPVLPIDEAVGTILNPDAIPGGV